MQAREILEKISFKAHLIETALGVKPTVFMSKDLMDIMESEFNFIVFHRHDVDMTIMGYDIHILNGVDGKLFVGI